MITEAEKLHILPSASWRPRKRKAGDVIQCESEGLRIWGADGVNPRPSWKGPRTRNADVRGQKRDVPAQEEKANPPFLQLFVLSRPSKDWMVPTSLARVPTSLARVTFIQSTDSNGHLFKIHPEIMFCQLSGHPLAQTS